MITVMTIQTPPEALSLDNWLEPPHNRRSLGRVDHVVPQTTLRRGVGAVREFGTGLVDSSEQRVAIGSGQETTLDEYLRLTYTDGIVGIRGEDILFERYLGHQEPESRHIVMSVSKSFAGMLAGTLVADRLLDLAAASASYVPELEGGSYAHSTVRELLDMTARPAFDMSYTTTESEVQAGDRAAGWRPGRPGDADGTRAFLSGLRGVNGAHGSEFQYCSATTDVLAWVLERAAGVPYAELMQRNLWQHLGAEDGAAITVDRHGTPYACAGMSMRLRDLARFGRLMLDRGIRDGTQILPPDWIADTLRGGRYDTAADDGHAPGTYRNQWWIPSDSSRHVMYAVGIFGQHLWLDFETDVLIAAFASDPDPLGHGEVHRHALADIAKRAPRWAVDTDERHRP